MNPAFQEHLSSQLEAIRAAGTYKHERVLSTPQGTLVRANGGGPVLNLCANKAFGIIFTWLLGQPVKDTLCGTKVLTKAHYERIARQIESDKTAVHTERVVDARTHQQRAETAQQTFRSEKEKYARLVKKAGIELQ